MADDSVLLPAPSPESSGKSEGISFQNRADDRHPPAEHPPDSTPGSSRLLTRQLAPVVPQGRRWLGFAALAFCAFSVCNFLTGAIGQLAADASEAVPSNFQLQALVDGAMGLGAWALLRCRGGGLRTKTRFLAFTQVASGVALGVGHMATSYGITFEGANLAFILAVMPANAVILSTACWVLRGEPATIPQCVSIVVLLTGLVAMSVEDSVRDGAAGVGFGLFAALCYAAGNFGIKDAALQGMGHATGVCLLLLGVGITGVLVFAIATVSHGGAFTGLGTLTKGGEPKSTGLLYAFSAISGLAQAVAVGSMALALAFGGAAPAVAIVTSNLSGVLLLNAIFFSEGVTVVQMVGLCLCVAGVVALALLPSSTLQVPRGGAKAPPALSAAAPLDETSLNTVVQRGPATASESSTMGAGS